MEKTRFVVRVAMCVALLIGGQMALSGVSGIEIVTVMLLCFCFHYGIRYGIAVATTFSLLRCIPSLNMPVTPTSAKKRMFLLIL